MTWRIWLQFSSLMIAVLHALGSCSAARAASTEWTRRLMSDGDDHGTAVAVDRLGNIFIAGATAGSLEGPFGGGYYDGFVCKYDSAGNLKWTHPLSTDGWDEATSVTSDGIGNVYVAGYTSGVLGDAKVGSQDTFVRKLDTEGAVLWTHQFGTDKSQFGSQYSRGIAADGLGNLYVTGITPADANSSNWDILVAKLDIAGNLLWTRQFGTTVDDSSNAIAADRLGNVFVTGHTFGSLGGPHVGNEIIPDAFVSKLDADGNVVWSQQLGGDGHDYGFGAATDDLGNVYIAGATNSLLGDEYFGGFHDAFLAKYDELGNRIWIRQHGSFGADEAYGIAIDGQDGVYVSGNTDGILEFPGLGAGNTFLTKYDVEGNIDWTTKTVKAAAGRLLLAHWARCLSRVGAVNSPSYPVWIGRMRS